MTALSWACLRGKVQAAQCLLDSGSDINCVNKVGRSPLDLAAFQGNPALTQVISVKISLDHSFCTITVIIFV